jgi:hypothetical protein
MSGNEGHVAAITGTNVSEATLPSIVEVTKTMPPQTVWQMPITGEYAYRNYRIPSLYPGAKW